MARIVEILGPSGVGKTSLYKKLQSVWEPDLPWAVYHDFRYKRNPVKKFPADYIEAVKKRLKPKEKISYQNFNESSVPKERLFFEAYPEFSNSTLELIQQYNKQSYGDNDRRFYNTFFMLETMEKVWSIMERKHDSRVCLMDEGFLSRIMHLNAPGFNELALDLYLQDLPLPNAVLYLQLDTEKIIDRIEKRERVASLHDGLNKNQIIESTKKAQRLMEMACEKISGMNVNVELLSADRDVDELAENVIQFVNSF